jgi:hypothetical protein
MKKKLIFLLFTINLNLLTFGEEGVDFKATSVPLFKSMTKSELSRTDLGGESQGEKLIKLQKGEKVEEVKPVIKEDPKKDITKQNKKTETINKIVDKNNVRTVLADFTQNREILTTTGIIVSKTNKIPDDDLKVRYIKNEDDAIEKAQVYITYKGNIIYEQPKVNNTINELKYGIKENIICFDKKVYNKPGIIKEHIFIAKKSYTVQNLVKDKRGNGYEIKLGNYFTKQYY